MLKYVFPMGYYTSVPYPNIISPWFGTIIRSPITNVCGSTDGCSYFLNLIANHFFGMSDLPTHTLNKLFGSILVFFCSHRNAASVHLALYSPIPVRLSNLLHAVRFLALEPWGIRRLRGAPRHKTHAPWRKKAQIRT